MKFPTDDPASQSRQAGRIAGECSETILLLVDVINDFAFPEGKQLLRYALPAARKLARFKDALAQRGIPAVYVNDNFGRWRSDFREQVEHCLGRHSQGSEFTRLLIPSEDDYFVLKPKHSGFYSTSLDILLSHVGAKKLIIAGLAADICVLFTANDAYMRGYEVIIPSDCIAAETTAACAGAIRQMKRFCHARVAPASAILKKMAGSRSGAAPGWRKE